MKAEGRPGVKFTGGEPRSGADDSAQDVVALLAVLSVHARKKTWSKSSYSPPASVSACLHGGAGSVAAVPPRTLGLPQDTVREFFASCSERPTHPRGERYRLKWAELRLPPSTVGRGARRSAARARPAAGVPAPTECSSRGFDGSRRPTSRRRRQIRRVPDGDVRLCRGRDPR